MNSTVRFTMSLRTPGYHILARLARVNYLTPAQYARYLVMEGIRNAPDATGIKTEQGSEKPFRTYTRNDTSNVRIRRTSETGRNEAIKSPRKSRVDSGRNRLQGSRKKDGSKAVKED